MNPVFFTKRLPSAEHVLARGGGQKQAVVLCDKRFKTHPRLSQWREDSRLDFYYLSPGEKSKSLERFPQHIKKILSLDRGFGKNGLLFISFGGGSLNDLTAFSASVYKRGRDVIHFPTTWLSALDSAHGGKTALNFQDTKNLLGSWLFPKAVFIVGDFLNENPDRLKREAFGEMLKIALLEGGGFYKKLKQEITDSPKGENIRWPDRKSWSAFVKKAIQAKRQIIRRDPFETRSLRQKLNLGHTVGHVLEAFHKIPHGEAVLRGLRFCLCFSLWEGFASSRDFEEMAKLIPPQRRLKKIPLILFKKLLMRDKKNVRPHFARFVFIKKPGHAVLKSVAVEELIRSARRQELI